MTAEPPPTGSIQGHALGYIDISHIAPDNGATHPIPSPVRVPSADGGFVARKVDPFVMDFITKGAAKLLFASPERQHQPRATRMVVA